MVVQKTSKVLGIQARSQDSNHGGLRLSQEGLHVVASAEGAKSLPTTGSGGAS